MKGDKKKTEEIKTEEVTETDYMEKKAVDCAVQHIKTFHSQALRGVQADFGEPCIYCPHVETCQYDWLSVMKPLMERSEIKIKM